MTPRMKNLPKATRIKGVCPTCGKPLRRYVEQKTAGSYEIEEKAVRCMNKKCVKQFMSRTVNPITKAVTFLNISDPTKEAK